MPANAADLWLAKNAVHCSRTSCWLSPQTCVSNFTAPAYDSLPSRTYRKGLRPPSCAECPDGLERAIAAGALHRGVCPFCAGTGHEEDGSECASCDGKRWLVFEEPQPIPRNFRLPRQCRSHGDVETGASGRDTTTHPQGADDMADTFTRKLGKMAAAHMRAAKSGGSYLSHLAKRDAALAEQVDMRLRGLSTDTVAGGGALTSISVGEVLPALAARSALIQFCRRIPLAAGARFDLPLETTTATAAFVDEASSMELTGLEFGNVAMQQKKVMALLLASDEMMADVEGFEEWAGSRLMEAAVRKVDSEIVNGTGTGGPGLRGLTNQLAEAHSKSLTGTSGTQVEGDLTWCVGRLERANVPTEDAAWLLHPMMRDFLAALQSPAGTFFYRESLDNGRLHGRRAVVSSAVPSDRIILTSTDPAHIVLTSTDAWDIAAGGAYVSGGVLHSAFVRGMRVLRLTGRVGFSLTRDVAAAQVTGYSVT